MSEVPDSIPFDEQPIWAQVDKPVVGMNHEDLMTHIRGLRELSVGATLVKRVRAEGETIRRRTAKPGVKAQERQALIDSL